MDVHKNLCTFLDVDVPNAIVDFSSPRNVGVFEIEQQRGGLDGYVQAILVRVTICAFQNQSSGYSIAAELDLTSMLTSVGSSAWHARLPVARSNENSIITT